MSKGQKLRALVNERLTAAAAEIFELFERTIAEYEQEVLRFKQTNDTQQQLLAAVLEPTLHSHTAGVQVESHSQEEVEPAHTKEEPELCIKQEEEPLQELPFFPVCVKTEDDEDKSSVLHQRATEENREETKGEDCGAEAGCSSDPLTQLHSDSEEHTDSSSDTDHSEDYSQEQAPAEGSHTVINPDSSVTDVGGTAKPHRCSECGKGFLRKDNLQDHMIVHTGEKLFKCPFCTKCYRQKRTLKMHIRIHTGEKPFSCTVCGNRFIQNSHLNRHMRTHTGEKPYKCEICSKEFALKDSLVRHMRLHTGEKPFSCTVCQKQFSLFGNLIRHKKIHNKDSTESQVKTPVHS